MKHATIFQANAISGQVCTWYPPSGWTVQYSGPGNNTMSVLSIAPWASTNTIVGVTVLFDGISVYDSHSVTIQSCPFYRLEAERKRSYSVAPQPASDFIVITSAGDEIDATLDIYDLSGRLISSTKGSFPVHKMRISDLPSGLYILTIRPIGLQPYITRIYVQ